MVRLRDLLDDLVRYPTLVGSLLVNFAPLVGVIFWGWGVGPLVVLYWLENVAVGFVTIVRMVLSGFSSGASAVSLLFIVPFFCFHYGMFCFVHGMFVMLLANGFAGGEGGVIDGGPQALFSAALRSAPGLLPMFLILTAWRFVLMGAHFVVRGEFRETNPMAEMAKPYGRIVTLHIAIFAGAFAMIALKQPAWGMFALIALKALYDFFSVRSEAKGPKGPIPAAAAIRAGPGPLGPKSG